MPFVIVNFLMIALVDFHDYVNVFLVTRQVQSHDFAIVLHLSLSDSHSVVVHLVLCELFVLNTIIVICECLLVSRAFSFFSF